MNVTQLLHAANDGDSQALEQLAPLVYDELRWLAHRQLQSEFAPRTLSTTALVHEAYVKLVSGPQLPAESRGHFFAVAARAMRNIMVSEARKRCADKRGGGAPHLDLNDCDVKIDEVSAELLSLDQALRRLEAEDRRLAQIVELRFFAGLTVQETALAVDKSPRTVKRDWRLARAWLYRELVTSASGATPG